MTSFTKRDQSVKLCKRISEDGTDPEFTTVLLESDEKSDAEIQESRTPQTLSRFLKFDPTGSGFWGYSF